LSPGNKHPNPNPKSPSPQLRTGIKHLWHLNLWRHPENNSINKKAIICKTGFQTNKLDITIDMGNNPWEIHFPKYSPLKCI
jgi:hypothetical protein